MTKTPVSRPEFSRPIAVDQVGPQEIAREIVANAAERARLAERFGLLSLDRLIADLKLKRADAGLIQVRGRFEAEVVQACVVTLEPVRSRLSEGFTVAFTTASGGDPGAVVIDPEDEDPPEELIEGRIDLGEMVAQQLAVALDPYPHAPGIAAETDASDQDDAREEKTVNPFAALAQLHSRRN
jgi:uncharacterized metal-binding protein YceD (DUF177 family)